MLAQGLKRGEGITLCHHKNIGNTYIEIKTEQNNVHFFEHTMPKESSKGKEMA